MNKMDEKEKIKNYFNKWAQGLGWVKLNYLNPLGFQGVIKEIPLEEESKVIDISCGSGWASRKIAKIVTKGEVKGIDISEDLIKRAKELTLKDKSYDYKNLEYKIAEAEDIPYPNDNFDYAISFHAFSWWDKPGKVLEEIERVLKPNGQIYIVDLPAVVAGVIFSKIFNYFSSCKSNIYSKEEYKKFFEKNFTNISQRNIYHASLLTIGTKRDKRN